MVPGCWHNDPTETARPTKRTKMTKYFVINPDVDVRVAAASDINITKEQLDIALTDPDWYVRAAAAGNININK